MLKKYILPWEAHPHKDAAWYEYQKTRLTADEVATELDRSYQESTTGRVFEAFKKRRHLIEEPIPVNEALPVYRIWDFGGVNAVLYGQIDNFGRRRAHRERILGTAETNSSTPEQIAVALEDSSRWFKHCHFIDICDPAGSYDDHRGKDTDVEMLNKEGIYPRYQEIIKIPTKDRKARARKLFILDLQRCPGGDDAFGLYVNPQKTEGCPTLLAALEGGYSFKKDRNGNITDVIREEHPYEDIIDNLLYWYLETKLEQDVDTSKYKPYYGSGEGNKYTGYK